MSLDEKLSKFGVLRRSTPNLLNRLMSEAERDLLSDESRYQNIKEREIIHRITGGSVPVSKSNVSILSDILDVYAESQYNRLRAKRHYEILEVVADWKSYDNDKERDKMAWVLYSSMDPFLQILGSIMAQYIEHKDRNFKKFLESLAGVPSATRRMLESELRREYRADINDLTRQIKALEDELRLQRRPEVTPVLPSATSAQTGYEATLVELRTVKRELSRLKDKYTSVQRQLHEARSELSHHRTRLHAPPISYSDYLSLKEFYEGRKVITIGGYRGNSPMGTTKNYFDFLRDTLRCEVTSYSAEVNPSVLEGALGGNLSDKVIIYFTYSTTHGLNPIIEKSRPLYMIRIHNRTFHETEFLRRLLEPIRQREKGK